MRSRALASPFGGAPRRGLDTSSNATPPLDFIVDIVTDLSVTSNVAYRSVTFQEDGDAGDRGDDPLGLRRTAADRIAQAAGGQRQSAGPSNGRRRHAPRAHDP